MFEIGLTSGSVEAVSTVGLVLGEAITLYIGYGILTHIASSTVLEALEGE
ncbi:DUF7512 family protein [Halegenticoccus soli]